MTSIPDLLSGALNFAELKIPVIQLRPGTKIPATSKWTTKATVDPKEIKEQWKRYPHANVGVLCGSASLDCQGLVVLDVDMPDGFGRLGLLLGQYSESGELPVTPVVKTPSGGRHFYFKGHTRSHDPAPGLEVRSDGRQCAAPPSALYNACGYDWEPNRTPFDVPFARLPSWLRSTTRAQRPPTEQRWQPTGLKDPVLDVPPSVYFRVLCGLEPDRSGFVHCPLHEDWEPSWKVYGTADRGWYCFGESCRKGGDVVTLAANLAGIPTPVRGEAFFAVLDYLRDRLL